MSVWGSYNARINADGITARERMLTKTRRSIAMKLPDSLSFQMVHLLGDSDAASFGLAIIDTQDMSEKKIHALPGESIPHGQVIEWSGTYWLITEVDAHNEVYESGKMKRCNYLLKWVDDVGSIIEKWCIVEDGTKYLIGEHEEPVITTGDSRLALTIGKDIDTEKLVRGCRFLIGDMDSEAIQAYEITKPNNLYNVFDGAGVFRFILRETNITKNDNCTLRIADYYNWRPLDPTLDHVDRDIPIEEIVEQAKEDAKRDRKGWL